MKSARVAERICYLVIAISTIGYGQTFELSIHNKVIRGTDLFFDLYMLRTSPAAIYLGHSDFVLTLQPNCFINPTVSVDSTIQRLDDEYDLDVSIQADSFLVFNIGHPAFADQAEFNSKIQTIENMGIGTLLGRIKITGVSEPHCAKELRWITEKNFMLQTLIFTLNDSPNWFVDEITSNGIYIDHVNFRAKVYLQGPYVVSADTMATGLRNLGWLPSRSPFADSTTTVVASVPDSVVDWVEVGWRQTLRGQLVDSVSAFLSKTGHLLSLDGSRGLTIDATAGWYYLVIKHRNHLAVMSSDSILFSLSGVTHDFTSGLDQAFGPNPMKDMGNGKFAMRSGDGNSDGGVDAIDLNSIWRPQNGTIWTYKKLGDFNLDGGIDAIDVNGHWRGNNGYASQLP